MALAGLAILRVAAHGLAPFLVPAVAGEALTAPVSETDFRGVPVAVVPLPADQEAREQ